MYKTSGTLAFFKGNGAAKFTIMYPKRTAPRKLNNGMEVQGYVDKAGAILVEAAPADGKRPDGLPNINWDQKITFAIGVPDIALLKDPKTDKLIHKTNETTKSLSFKPGTGKYADTFNMYLNQSNGTNKQSVHVGLTHGEFSILRDLLTMSLPILIGWD